MAAEKPRRPIDVAARQHRAVGADDDHGRVAAERAQRRMVHAGTEILAALSNERHAQRKEEAMAPRAVQLRSVALRERKRAARKALL